MFKQTLRTLIPNSLVNAFWHLPQAVIANVVNGLPSRKLTVIGVTGTDGKTTSATMLYHILLHSGYKVALISTVAAKIGPEEIDTGFHVTSPDPVLLQKLLSKIASKGFTHVVLEATSHGLDQYRFWGIDFRVGIVTNITQDHLDYHKTWEKYAQAKARLFSNTEYAILNTDDKSFNYLKSRVHGHIITYGENTGDWSLKTLPLKLFISGKFNYLNSLAAAAAASQIGVSKEMIIKALESFPGVKGRMEIMQQKPFLVVVDFAHTPNALLQALTELRLQTTGRLIAVYGCAGDRDKNRRKMGLVSAQHADITVITAEDPREEGVENISNEIADWAKKGGAGEVSIKSQIPDTKRNVKHVFIKIPDREEAIKWALTHAEPGDTVGVFGKGHEQSICYGNKELPWSDQEVTKRLMLELPYNLKGYRK